MILLCALFVTPNDSYAKGGNGEDTLHHVKWIFSPDSRIGRNSHSLLLKTNAGGVGNGGYKCSGGV